jgi:hypothetical protein
MCRLLHQQQTEILDKIVSIPYRRNWETALLGQGKDITTTGFKRGATLFGKKTARVGALLAPAARASGEDQGLLVASQKSALFKFKQLFLKCLERRLSDNQQSP